MTDGTVSTAVPGLSGGSCPKNNARPGGDRMEIQKLVFLLVNLVGGVAVIGSYFAGIRSQPSSVKRLWGKVTPAVKRMYMSMMPLAAAGYIIFACFILFQLDAGKALVGITFGFEIFSVIFVCILLPSALWMPLSLKVVKTQDKRLWSAVRIVLFTVGLASLALLVSLLALNQREPAWFYWSAVAGAIVFFIQTGIIDAFIWPVLFKN
jgi:hypothetical protein